MQITLIAAFLGGIFSLLSPCSAMVIPTFLAATSGKRSTKLILVSLIFSLGLLVSLLPLALGAVVLSQFIMIYRRPLTLLIGIALSVSAALVLFIDHLPFPDLRSFITIFD